MQQTRGGARFAKDVVCGMQVERARASALAHRRGQTYYFCSDRCHARFVADPDRYADGRVTGRVTETMDDTADARTRGDPSVDPVCGMAVDPARPAAAVVADERRYLFCSAGCAETFDADPNRYRTPGVDCEPRRMP